MKKGYCRYRGVKCRHLKLHEWWAVCKKNGDYFSLPKLYGESISKKRRIDIKTYCDCPRVKH